MANIDLKKLSRADLLEILLAQTKELEEVKAQLEEAQAELADRKIVTEKAGSIAEAALQLNGVFEAAQKACVQYIENIRDKGIRQERILEQVEKETKEECARMIMEAKKEAASYREEVRRKVRAVYGDDPRLQSLWD
ncbi:MAG: hypothetical protein IKU83_02215 [Lachnospiraceae bacterium]|nr:hypothetical protein [Lachnospiraceae bacterium]